MKPNVGTIDRALRILLGLGIIAWGVTTHTWLGAIGIIPLFTGIIRWCPAYTPFGISTCGKDKPNGGCGGGGCC